MKKISLLLFLVYSIILSAYNIKIDYSNNTNFIKLSDVSTNATVFMDNTKTDYKIAFKDTAFENKSYILPKGPVKMIKLYDNTLELIMIFPVDIDIKSSKDISITITGKQPLNDELFHFKTIKIKDLLDILLKELGFNKYYLTEIPDKNISLELKNFYPEDLFRIIFDSTGLYYDYLSTKDIYISKNKLYSENFPIINSNKSNEKEEFELINSTVPNFSSIIKLLNLSYVKISDSLYLVKGDSENIDLIKEISFNISSITDNNTNKNEKAKKENIEISYPSTKTNSEKTKEFKLFNFNLPQKDIIKDFNIEYTEISDNLLLLKGYNNDLYLFEKYYNIAYDIYSKNKENKKDDEISKNSDYPKITEDSTYAILKTPVDIGKISPLFDLKIDYIDNDIYVIKGSKKNIEKMKNINNKIKDLISNDSTKINCTEESTISILDNPATITVINTTKPIDKLADILNLDIIELSKDNYVVKGRNINLLMDILSKIPQRKESEINKKANNNNIKNTIKIKIIQSNLDLLPFNKIFKNTIIQKIDKNYIIKGTEDDIKIIENFNDKYNIIEATKTINDTNKINDFYISIKNDKFDYFDAIAKNMNIQYDAIYSNNVGKIIRIKSNLEDYKKLYKLLSLKNTITTITKDTTKTNVPAYKTLFELVEIYAKNNNLALINDEKLKNIKVFNYNNIEDIEKILEENNYYMDKEKMS